jgi:microcystin-dependent protein
MFAGSFAPAGWMFCDGSQLPISENETLFQLIGTTYGGDGQQTFNLPDLRGRVPLHFGTLSGQGIAFQLAETGGTEEVTLTTQQMPSHSHPMLGTGNNATTTSPNGAVAAVQPIFGVKPYGLDNPKTTLNPSSVSIVGGSQPHTNTQPFLCISFIISLFGIFPSQT